jgi:hypothetical protein
MNQLKDAMGVDLYWEQPKLSQQNFVLRSADDSFAQLNFVSTFNSTARATTADGGWVIKQSGFFSNQVNLRLEDSQVELASYQPNWLGTSGEIQFSMGVKYRWNVVGATGSRFNISMDGNELITYISGARDRKFSNLFKQQAQMVMAADAWQINDLPVLVLLGWYLVILHYENAALVASTASLGALY